MFILTGATGHIGNTLARLFLAEGRPLKLLLRKSGPAVADLDCPLAFGDIFDPAFLEREVSPGDVFLHVAGMIDLTRNHREELFAVNEAGTRVIADFCRQRGIRLVYLSSTDAIWKSDKTSFVREPEAFFPERFRNDSSASKAAGTAYVHELMTNGGLDAVILYPAAVIGPNDFKPSQAGQEIKNSLTRRLLFYLRGGYSFIDVRDTAEAIREAAVRPLTGGYILSGHSVTIREFYETIARILGRKVLLVRVSALLARIGAMFMHEISPAMVDALLDNHNFDNARMRRDLLHSLRPFEETVRDTIGWFRDHPEIGNQEVSHAQSSVPPRQR